MTRINLWHSNSTQNCVGENDPGIAIKSYLVQGKRLSDRGELSSMN